MFNLIYDVINYCVWSCDIGKIVMKTWNTVKDGNTEILHEIPYKGWFQSGDHSLQMPNDERSSAYIIWRILQFYASRHKYTSGVEYFIQSGSSIPYLSRWQALIPDTQTKVQNLHNLMFTR